MCFKKLDEIDVSYSDRALGLERYVRGIWALHMYRHHVFRVNLPDSLFQKINQINASLGITVQSIDLNNYKENYGEAEDLNSLLEENEYPKWIWIYGVEALKDTCFSGWLRSRLTVRIIENLRVVFVTDSHQSYRDVFCDYRVPFYQSTILLQTDSND
ncbi:hypothetical protein VoSk93_12400 [Vibrio owensii]|uniref:hypothetical protein n=1 Tax=Vibrio owensii TaxID=696485 RepID=UPI0038CF0506